jgi:hypothetical protein
MTNWWTPDKCERCKSEINVNWCEIDKKEALLCNICKLKLSLMIRNFIIGADLK